MSADERLTRESVLLLKTGRLNLARLEARYAVDPLKRFKEPIEALIASGLAAIREGTLTLSRDALLQVDRLLPAFFAQEHSPEIHKEPSWTQR